MRGRDEGVVARVKRLRVEILPDMVDEDLLEGERQRRWRQLADCYLAQQLSLYPTDYIGPDRPAERILETIERFEEDLADVATVHGPLTVLVEVGEAIEVSPRRTQKSEGKINWNENADKIIGKINGLYPYPGAFFLFNGERYKILKAEKSHSKGKAGNIISEDFEICCGEGSIKVLTIQREGKRVQQINEFLLGTQIKKGANIA